MEPQRSGGGRRARRSLAGLVSRTHARRARGIVHYTEEAGLATPNIRTIFEGSDGRLYAVGRASWIHRFAEDHWEAVRPRLPGSVGRAGHSQFGAAVRDQNGSWWIGSGEGLYRFPPVESFQDLATTPPGKHFTTADGLAGNEISKLFEDSRGDIWITTRNPKANSLTRWRRRTGEFENFGKSAGLPPGLEIASLTEDSSGGLWLGFYDGGLARFDGERFTFIPPDGPLPAGPVRGMIVDAAGTLWATVGDSLVRIERAASAEHREIHRFRPGGGRLGQIAGVTMDNEGRIYLNSLAGLFRFRPHTRALQRLGTGVPFSNIQTFCRDRQGDLWFGSPYGILRLTPEPPELSAPPPVRIQAVRVSGTSYPVSPMGSKSIPELQLQADQNQLQIGYFGVAFGPDQPLRYQYRLVGASPEWSTPTLERSVLFASLSPGSYRFAVRAVNAIGEPSAHPATIAFTIPPPWWRRWWFLTALGLLLAGLLLTFHRQRLRRLLEVERVRTRIASDLHDDLGSSLARVSLLTELARRDLERDPESSARVLGEIGETSRQLVATAGDIAYAMDPARGSLPALVARLRRFSEDLVSGNGAEFRLELHGDPGNIDLSAEQRRHLLALLKEAVHNAVKHAQAGSITVRLNVEDGALTADVGDDGRGFEIAKHESGDWMPPGHGLRNMRRRARDLGARLVIGSSPGEGTRIRLHLPL